MSGQQDVQLGAMERHPRRRSGDPAVTHPSAPLRPHPLAAAVGAVPQDQNRRSYALGDATEAEGFHDMAQHEVGDGNWPSGTAGQPEVRQIDNTQHNQRQHPEQNTRPRARRSSRAQHSSSGRGPAFDSGPDTVPTALGQILSRLSELHRGSRQGAMGATAADGDSGPDTSASDPENPREPRLRRTLMRELSRRPQEVTSVASSSDSDSEDEGSMAATAERHRLASSSGMDVQAMAVWVEQALPFLTLLIVSFLQHHILGIFVCCWLFLATMRCNELIRKQVALKEERRFCNLLSALSLVAVHAASGHLLLLREDLQHFYSVFPYIQPNKSVWHTIYVGMVLDSTVRFWGMLAKILLLLFHKNEPGKAFRKQTQALTFAEHAVLALRTITPAGLWVGYFLEHGFGPADASLNAGLYLSFKLFALYDKVLLVGQSLKAAIRCEAQYGQYASPDDLIECGNTCTICQETMTAPLKLSCKHIFCEDCVSEWFEREPTCPLCRSVVKPAGLRSFGDGGTSIAPQFF